MTPLFKNTYREILRSPGRFLAILAIIVLGSGFFVGLRVSQKAMTATAAKYLEDAAFYDFSLAGTLGLDDAGLEAIKNDPAVLDAEGAFETDALVTLGGTDVVYSFHSLPGTVNTPALVAGRLPESPEECLADSWTALEPGDTVTLSDGNDADTLELFTRRSFTVVGVATSPLYLNFERGSTELGTGSVSGFCYVPMSAFDADYYTAVYVRCKDMPRAYSDAYDSRADELEEHMTDLAEAQSLSRYDSVVSKAQAELDDAQAEYDDAEAEYLSKRADAERELDDAKRELEDARRELDDAEAQIADGRREIDDGWRELYDSEPALEDARLQLADAELELADAKAQIDDGLAEYNEGLADFNEQKSEGEEKLADARRQLNDASDQLQAGEEEYLENLAAYEDGERQYSEGLAQYNEGLVTYNSAHAQYEAGLREYESGLADYEAGKKELEDNAGTIESLRSTVATYDTLMVTLLGYVNQTLPEDARFPDVDSLIAALSVPDPDPDLVLAVNSILTVAKMMYQQAPADVEGLLAMDAQVTAAREAIAKYDAGVAALPGAERQLADARSVLSDARVQLEAGREELDRSLAVLKSSREQLDEAKAQLEAGREELDSGWQEYMDGLAEYNASQAEFDSAITEAQAELDSARAELDDAQRQYDEGLAEYEKGRAEYEDGVREYNDGKARLRSAEADLADAESKYAEGLAEYEEGLAEYEDARAKADSEFADAEAELRDARREIDDAREELHDLAHPEAYVLGRWGNLGYVCFENDTSIVRAVSAVFPVFFFLVAALICLTTVSRMVEEQRSQLGVLLALGYSRPAIISKFLFYSGTATVAGGAAGILLGSKLIPMVVWKAYGIMYTFSDAIEFVFDLPLSSVTFSLYVVSMLAVTLVTCRRELRDVPANIIRPKPPRSGKRVILERVPFIWNRLSFLWKVTVRNIFRYRSRVLMMILGIAGCTALMMTGMGINDSVRNVVDYQFTEISLYDYTVTFSGDLTAAEREEFTSGISGFAAETVFLDQESVTAGAGRAEKEVQLNVLSEDALQRVSDFVDFHAGSRPVELPGDGELLINSGLAESLGLKAGDTVSLRFDSGRSAQLTVCGVYDNYIYNSVYMTAASYAAALGREPGMNYALVKGAPGKSSGEGLAAILSQPNVLTSASSADMRARIGGMMDSLIYIVILTIVCAAALAFVVIYNLTNINIQERLREIATVKVLGFYDPETALYVLRENFILTFLGAAAGMPMGFALNAYVVTRIDLDMIHFTPRVLPMSCVWSVALTFLFSITVDLLMLRRLARIDPAAALKAAE